ncbi:MAG: class II aldolase/adducin family protein [Candidatus Promineifilaceae bacterium]
MRTAPELIAYMGRVMFERHLTDMAGGNISIREGDKVYLSPTMAAHKWHWQLEPKDIISGSLHTDDLQHHPRFSREGLSHLAVYRAYPQVKGIVHAHPLYVQPFAVMGKPIEPMMYYTDKYGTIGFIDSVPNYSQEQADNIVLHLRDKLPMIEKAAAALLMPRHGIFVVGRDIYCAMDAVDRINVSAYCMTVQKLFAPDDS